MSEDLRTLPHNLEAERSVLGACLISPASVLIALEAIEPRDFFRRAHKAIFEAIIALGDRNEEVDLVTVKAELERSGGMDEVGGPAYIAALTDGVPKSGNVRYYCGIVREHAVRRAIIKLGNQAMGDAYDGEKRAAEILADADRRIMDLSRNASAGELVDLSVSSGELYHELEKAESNRGKLWGVDTGFASLNEFTFGWLPGELTVVAARPSVGKSAFTLNCAVAAAKHGKRVAIFSLEMRRRQLEWRLFSHLSGVQLTRIMGGWLGELDYERLSQGMGLFTTLPIFVNDRGGQTIGSIRSKCRQMKAEGGLDLVIIDYVQLIKSTMRSSNRNEQLTEISRLTKELTDEVAAPILLCSQLSRAGEKEGRRPVLSDLRECGALEQDADNVVFLHRKNHRESGRTECIVEKQRNGPAGTVNLMFDRDTQTFTDAGKEPEQPALPEAPEEKAKPRKPRPWRG